MLLVKNLHIENILKFFILYGTANFCMTPTLMKYLIEALPKGENSLVVTFQIMEPGHIVSFAMGKAVKVATL